MDEEIQGQDDTNSINLKALPPLPYMDLRDNCQEVSYNGNRHYQLPGNISTEEFEQTKEVQFMSVSHTGMS